MACPAVFRGFSARVLFFRLRTTNLLSGLVGAARQVVEVAQRVVKHFRLPGRVAAVERVYCLHIRSEWVAQLVCERRLTVVDFFLVRLVA